MLTKQQLITENIPLFVKPTILRQEYKAHRSQIK